MYIYSVSQDPNITMKIQAHRQGSVHVSSPGRSELTRESESGAWGLKLLRGHGNNNDYNVHFLRSSSLMRCFCVFSLSFSVYFPFTIRSVSRDDLVRERPEVLVYR